MSGRIQVEPGALCQLKAKTIAVGYCHDNNTVFCQEFCQIFEERIRVGNMFQDVPDSNYVELDPAGIQWVFTDILVVNCNIFVVLFNELITKGINFYTKFFKRISL